MQLALEPSFRSICAWEKLSIFDFHIKATDCQLPSKLIPSRGWLLPLFTAITSRSQVLLLNIWTYLQLPEAERTGFIFSSLLQCFFLTGRNYEYYSQIFLVQRELHYTSASLMLIMNKDEMSGREGWVLSESGRKYNSAITDFCNK